MEDIQADLRAIEQRAAQLAPGPKLSELSAVIHELRIQVDLGSPEPVNDARVNRCCAIWKQQFGSGIALTDRLILTCDHVAGDESTQVLFGESSATLVPQGNTKVLAIDNHPFLDASLILTEPLAGWPSGDLLLASPQSFLNLAQGGRSALIAGFGETSFAAAGRRRHKDTVPWQHPQTASHLYNPKVNLLVGARNQGGPCAGDSGGPVWDGSTLIGISARAASCGSIAVAIRVDQLRDWIESTAIEWNTPPPLFH
jgi:hypothetical protein